jgi:hypothetical protein
MDLHARLRRGVADPVDVEDEAYSQDMIHVNPEAHLNISSIPLSFPVVNPGEVVVMPPVTIRRGFGRCQVSRYI